jgi:kinesin family protein 20
MISELDVHEDHVIDVDTFEDELGFCLFVSYVEIYSEFIYDLLGDKPEGGRQRPCLKLAADKHGNQYIKGLREVQVHSAKEAFDLLRIGLCHRHIAETSLNHNSSRGHTLYTIKLVRMKKGLTKPSVARVNRITIVDLAGSERSSKTKAHGERIKEAGSINTSLLTLGRCIETLRSNQNKKMQYQRQIVPFRDSKLTMLLQSHFIERESLEGRIIMITNISSTSTVYNETSHVLKFSAIASKVTDYMPLGSHFITY